MGSKFRRKVSGIVLAVLLLHLVWYGFSLWVNKPILPSPMVVYQNFGELFQQHLWGHLSASLLRVSVGMLIALFLGSALGLLMGSSKRWNQVLDPIVYLTYPIPKLALLPMLMLLFGLGEVSKITLIVFIVFPQVTLAVRDGVKQIPAHYYDIYQCLQASSWQKFRQITFPASYSALLSTSRISLGTAISVLFFTENYGTQYGMGYYIMDSWTRMDYPAMYGGILILSCIGFILFILIDALGWWGMRWNREA